MHGTVYTSREKSVAMHPPARDPAVVHASPPLLRHSCQPPQPLDHNGYSPTSLFASLHTFSMLCSYMKAITQDCW